MFGQCPDGTTRTPSVALSVQAATLRLCAASCPLATGKRGLKTGLKHRWRTVIVFLDSTILSEVPPLRAMWAPIGQQACVPIIGSHDRRFLTGAMSIQTGDYIDYVSAEFHQEQFQTVLRQIRSHWRGWRIVLFVDRNSAHKARASRRLAHKLRIQLRWLPKACSELNVMDHLWRHVKNDVAANEPTPNVDATVRRAQRYVHSLSVKERLQKAGVLSDDFWLADVLK
jgi:transposase